MQRATAALLVTSTLLVSFKLAAAQSKPARPTVDTTRNANVFIRCYDPASSATLTSPTFRQYLQDIQQTFTIQTPLLLTAQCKRQKQSGGLAVCQYSLDDARGSGALLALADLTNYPSLLVEDCVVALDGGVGSNSPSCFTNSTEALPSVLSGVPESDLGNTQFGINLQDNNAATGGSRAGEVQVVFTCKYYTPAGALPQQITSDSVQAAPAVPVEALYPKSTADVVPWNGNVFLNSQG